MVMADPQLPQKPPKKRANAIAQIVGQFCAEFGIDVDETVSKEYILNFFKGEKKKIQTKWGIVSLPEFLEIMRRENFNLGNVVKSYQSYEKRKKRQRDKVASPLLTDDVTIAKLIRFVEISALRCPDCGELCYLESPNGNIKIPEDYGIHTIDEWNKKMDEYMGWIIDARNKKDILNAISCIEDEGDEWKESCNTIRYLIGLKN